MGIVRAIHPASSTPLSLAAKLRVTLIIAVSAVAALTFLAFQPSSAGAQTGPATISDIDCSGDPEVVTILNGNAATDFTGWSLASDPISDESFDLSDVGELAAGVSVNVQAGPAASGSLVWSQEEVLRDDDASDFARLVDDTGATVDEAACAEATPTPAPTAEPTATPGGVPNGGGPFAPSSEPLTILVYSGAGLSAAALLFVAFTLAPMAAVRSLIPGRRERSEVEEPATHEPGSSVTPLLIAGAGLALLLLLVTVAIGVRRHR